MTLITDKRASVNTVDPNLSKYEDRVNIIQKSDSHAFIITHTCWRILNARCCIVVTLQRDKLRGAWCPTGAGQDHLREREKSLSESSSLECRTDHLVRHGRVIRLRVLCPRLRWATYGIIIGYIRERQRRRGEEKEEKKQDKPQQTMVIPAAVAIDVSRANWKINGA